METIQAELGSYEWIHGEIQRRASALAESNSAGPAGEDPYVIASREVFGELLRKFAEVAQAHAA
jgi:hypothetical protein